MATESLATRSFYDKLFYYMEVMSSVNKETGKKGCCAVGDITRAYKKVGYASLGTCMNTTPLMRTQQKMCKAVGVSSFL